jgi:RimJ/RimL family protein N-acetyltransferase
MSENERGVRLSALAFRKLPLRYGTESCYITLTDDRYAEETIALRNNPALGTYINYVELSAQAHQEWLASQLERDDALNFALVSKQRFSGTLSLYDIQHGRQCELGRVMMPNDGRRIYALAAGILGISFAFDILGVQTLYCTTAGDNKSVFNSQLRTGWKIDPRFDRVVCIRDIETRLIGLSMDRADWPKVFARMAPVARRLFSPDWSNSFDQECH